MREVGKTIGTKVSYCFETTSGIRPTSGYTILEDCTSHPDFNAEREQIETTTLIQENNHTYTSGLRDFGTLAFGFNLTQAIYNLFLGTNGIMTQYATKDALGLRLWMCVDIKAINKSFFIPVEPQDFGMPEGTAGSNKYDLSINFNAVGDGGWFDRPTYTGVTYKTITVTVTGSSLSDYVEGAVVELLGERASLTNASGVATFNVVAGTYDIKVTKEGIDAQYKEAVVTDSDVSVAVTGFNA